MKLTITREDLRQFVLKEANIDIGQTPIDIDIEGYKQMTGHYKWQETTETTDKDSLVKEMFTDVDGKVVIGDTVDRKVITDKEGMVLDIVKEEKEPKKAKIKDNRANNRANLKSHPDYTDYENTVLDFATSTEHKRQVPFFGAETISCVKERYRKVIRELGVSDSVKFSRINYLPYLVKIEGQESMNDILNKGVNT